MPLIISLVLLLHILYRFFSQRFWRSTHPTGNHRAILPGPAQQVARQGNQGLRVTCTWVKLKVDCWPHSAVHVSIPLSFSTFSMGCDKNQPEDEARLTHTWSSLFTFLKSCSYLSWRKKPRTLWINERKHNGREPTLWFNILLPACVPSRENRQAVHQTHPPLLGHTVRLYFQDSLNPSLVTSSEPWNMGIHELHPFQTVPSNFPHNALSSFSLIMWWLGTPKPWLKDTWIGSHLGLKEIHPPNPTELYWGKARFWLCRATEIWGLFVIKTNIAYPNIATPPKGVFIKWVSPQWQDTALTSRK